jgi:hypothetical protein
MKVSLKGVSRLSGESDIQRIKDAMGPGVVSFEALAWYFYDTLLEGKHLADAATLSGEHRVALRLYEYSANQMSRWRLSPANQGSAGAASAIPALTLDILISLAYLQVKTGDMKGLEFISTLIGLLLYTMVVPSGQSSDGAFEQANARARHIFILEELFVQESKKMTGYHAKTVGEVIERLSEAPDELYHKHDLGILEAVENREDPASSRLLRERCSAYKLETIISTVHKSSEFPQKPDHFVGMQNMDALLRLTAGKKEEINTMQRRFRAQVTQWD